MTNSSNFIAVVGGWYLLLFSTTEYFQYDVRKLQEYLKMTNTCIKRVYNLSYTVYYIIIAHKK